MSKIRIAILALAILCIAVFTAVFIISENRPLKTSMNTKEPQKLYSEIICHNESTFYDKDKCQEMTGYGR